MNKRIHPIFHNCIMCNKESKWDGHKSNKYCSNQCQHDYQYKDRVRQWLEEGKDWGQQIPKWVHRTLGEKRGYHCEVCGIDKHNGKNIVLECDHVDGDHTNNKIDNLRLICPNCHSQSSNYKGKNKGNGRAYRKERYAIGLSY